MTPQPLFNANQIGDMLGMSRHWVHNHRRKNPSSLGAQFTAATRGADRIHLWTAEAVDRWRAYHAGSESLPATGRYATYSDHKAINQVGPVTVSWKLWWRLLHTGPQWWFSTPWGWFVSDDDGRSWNDSELMVRPSDYRYFSVNGSVSPGTCVSMILRECGKLRRRVEKENKE